MCLDPARKSVAVWDGVVKHKPFRLHYKSAQQQLLGQHPSSSSYRGILRAFQHGKSVGSRPSGFGFLCKSGGRFPQLRMSSIKTACL